MKNSSTEKFDRNSPGVAREIIETLAPEGDQRTDVLRFFANSIRLAHQLAPDKWGVTLYENLVRLNVGMIEVGGIFSGGIHLVLDPTTPAEPSPENRVVEDRLHSYKSVPCYFWNFDLSEAAQVLPRCALSHRKLIEKAARTRRNAATAQAHAPGVLRYFEQELGETLPNPAFDKEAVPPPPSDNVNVSSIIEEVTLPEEVRDGSAYSEGTVRQILVNRYERDPRARERCIEHYGSRCSLCGFDFEPVYGQQMKGFIHVHHLKPLSSVGADYEVDPIADLRPVCPNCHAVLHQREPPFSLDEVSDFLQLSGG